jgi:hypothetical protein
MSAYLGDTHPKRRDPGVTQEGKDERQEIRACRDSSWDAEAALRQVYINESI